MNGPYIEQKQKQKQNQNQNQCVYKDFRPRSHHLLRHCHRAARHQSQHPYEPFPTFLYSDEHSPRQELSSKEEKKEKRKKGKKEKRKKITRTVRHNNKKIKKLKKTSRNNKAFKIFFIHNLTCLFLSSSCSNFFSSRNFVSSIFNSCSLIVSLFAFVMNTGLITSSSSSSSSVSVSYSESDGSGSSIFDIRACQLLGKYFYKIFFIIYCPRRLFFYDNSFPKQNYLITIRLNH